MAWLRGGGTKPLIAQPYVSSMTDAGRHQNHMRAIHSAIATIITFSVSETKPSGTLLLPPTHAHLMSRLSIYTALNTDTAPMPPMNSAIGTDSQGRICAVINRPARPSAKG